MNRVFIAILAAAAAVLAAAGCGGSRDGLGRGSLEPQAVANAPAGLDAGGLKPGDEVSPVAMPPPTLARPKDRPPAEPSAAMVPPARNPKYEARPEEAPLPVVQEPAPATAETPPPTPLVDAVLAEVNGEVITREDILGSLRRQMDQWRKEYSSEAFESRCREVVDLKLRQAISKRLVVQEAKANLSERQKEEIEATLTQTIKDMIAQVGSQRLLEEKLRREGASFEDEKTKERERLLVQRFLRGKIPPTIHITRSELLNYYNEVRPERYVVPSKAHLALITIKKGDAIDRARALAEAVHERAVAGEDFLKLAERYNRDAAGPRNGDWGLVTRGAFRIKAVDDVLFALERGQVGPLVETDEAYYVVKALDRQEGRTVPLAEVQDKLEEEIRDKKYNEAVSKYIQGLYERSYVHVNRENL